MAGVRGHVRTAGTSCLFSLCLYKRPADPKSSASAAAAQPAAEFLSFSESDPRNDSSYTQPSFACGPVKAVGEGGAPEGAPPLSTAGPPMSLPPAPAASGSKPVENSRSGSSAGYKRSSSAAAATTPPADDGAKFKKKRGKWRNRYGPCWSLDTAALDTSEQDDHMPQGPLGLPEPSFHELGARRHQTPQQQRQ
ncbi:hypothetical protein SKAU_G00383420 [Synaphobranchus kaupii]|uniref:Uncharacterized protein n=1 Tax=Synaphobranchus kaupii TaxID=118154 RepID=A0A9Q1EE56_SYNKA|nr:hypothetical protein SKAU_G00383420 [Synaphobranchus kaupii]